MTRDELLEECKAQAIRPLNDGYGRLVRPGKDYCVHGMKLTSSCLLCGFAFDFVSERDKMVAELEQLRLKAAAFDNRTEQHPVNRGVVILPFTSPRPDWPERFEFWLMRYLKGPEEVVGKYACPGGGIEEGETPLDAAVREFDEETGLRDLARGRFVPLGEPSVHERKPTSARYQTHGRFYTIDYFAIRLGSRESWGYVSEEVPRYMEPEKHSVWTRHGIFNLPHPVTEATEIAIGRFMTCGNFARLCG